MGTGGSRYGAGRPATHVKAEHCRRIDVRRWQREGILEAGRSGGRQWVDQETGKQTSAISYRSSGDSVTLSYSIDGEPRTQVVWLAATACNYGGTRQWFTCPIRGERVAVLFLRAGRFACRHCQRIAYESQSGDVCDRTWSKQRKAEAKLGPNGARRKGMHSTTRERLLSLIWECEKARHAALLGCIGALIRRYPSWRSDPLLTNDE